jgi:hypothetical protein
VIEGCETPSILWPRKGAAIGEHVKLGLWKRDFEFVYQAKKVISEQGGLSARNGPDAWRTRNILGQASRRWTHAEVRR